MGNPSFGADDPIETIIQRYADLVYKLAYAKTRHPHDAEDIFQEVFLRYIQKQPKFQSPDHEKAWFIRVTVNCSLSALNSSFKKRLSHWSWICRPNRRRKGSICLHFWTACRRITALSFIFFIMRTFRQRRSASIYM